MSFLYREAQTWTQHSRYGLTSAKQQRRITSLNLLAPLLMQNTIDLLCCKDAFLAYVQLVVHPGPQVLFCKAASQMVGPQCILVHVAVPHQMHFQFLRFL